MAIMSGQLGIKGYQTPGFSDENKACVEDDVGQDGRKNRDSILLRGVEL